MKNILVKIIIVFIALFSVISFAGCDSCGNNDPQPSIGDNVDD